MYKTLLDSQSVLDTSGETSIFETFRNPVQGTQSTGSVLPVARSKEPPASGGSLSILGRRNVSRDLPLVFDVDVAGSEHVPQSLKLIIAHLSS